MNKERLGAFMDAVIAIIMTILVLDLEQPKVASLSAIWDLRVSYFSYALSFFWLGAMWVNLHNEWHLVKKINVYTVWWAVLLLFFASFFTYVTNFVDTNFNSSVAQDFYGAIVLLVSFCNVAFYNSIKKANRDDQTFQKRMSRRTKWTTIDLIIKGSGFILAFVYPPAMMYSVLITLIVLVIPAQFSDKSMPSN